MAKALVNVPVQRPTSALSCIKTAESHVDFAKVNSASDAAILLVFDDCYLHLYQETLHLIIW